MARLESRLVRLEERFKDHAGQRSSGEDFEDAISREVLRRMTTDELLAYEAAVERLIEKGTRGEPLEPPEEDWPIWHRQQELHEEVRNEQP